MKHDHARTRAESMHMMHSRGWGPVLLLCRGTADTGDVRAYKTHLETALMERVPVDTLQPRLAFALAANVGPFAAHHQSAGCGGLRLMHAQ
jgi:hypothetical protein